ncbi:MAG: GGDEF domain-containing protein [Patescibacteria group bacterium]|nr:GGDEF domain-containing protein [Patescibacteria group bacterium]
MSEDTAEITRKQSKNPKNQEWVESQKEYLRKRNHVSNEAQLVQHARDRVAARLKLEKRAKEYARLLEQSEKDTLTGVLNRGAFEKRLEQEQARMARTGSKAVLIALDVNGLKQTNDTLGHTAGDNLIKGTADALVLGSRKIDYVARFGEKGDEFKVLLLETDLEGASTWWKNVNEILEQKGIKIAAGASELDSADIEKTNTESDRALYEAKAISKSSGSNLMLRSDQLKKVTV